MDPELIRWVYQQTKIKIKNDRELVILSTQLGCPNERYIWDPQKPHAIYDVYEKAFINFGNKFKLSHWLTSYYWCMVVNELIKRKRQRGRKISQSYKDRKKRFGNTSQQEV